MTPNRDVIPKHSNKIDYFLNKFDKPDRSAEVKKENSKRALFNINVGSIK